MHGSQLTNVGASNNLLSTMDVRFLRSGTEAIMVCKFAKYVLWWVAIVCVIGGIAVLIGELAILVFSLFVLLTHVRALLVCILGCFMK